MLEAGFKLDPLVPYPDVLDPPYEPLLPPRCPEEPAEVAAGE